jgi:hypothetical protein
MPYGTVSADLVVGTNGGKISPENTFGFRNRIINGAMVIDQRNAGASVTTTSGGGFFYSTDRWQTYNLAGANFTTQQVTDAPTGFVNSTRLTFTNAISLTTTGEATYQQVIEGYNVSDLGWGTANATTITVGFWVKASFTGTFSVGFCNEGGTRAYATTYTVSSANTWEFKTVTVAGDTSGTWLKNNLAGLYLRFNLATGSNFAISSNNAWTTRTGGYNAADSIYGTRAVGAATSISAGATWQITGVQLEVGSNATSFEYRPYGTELALCQRYCMVISGGTACYGTATGGAPAYRMKLVQFVPLRASPTTTFSGMAVAVPGIAGQALSSVGTTYFVNGIVEYDLNAAAGYGASTGQTAVCQGALFIASSEL